MKDDLISRKAVLESLGKPHPLDYNAIADVQKIIALPAVPAVPLDKLCTLLAKNADCPPEHSPVQNYCKENCAECWELVLKKWMEEQDAVD